LTIFTMSSTVFPYTTLFRSSRKERAMKRREFLIGAGAAAGLVSRRNAWAQAREEVKLRRVAIMSLCFNSILKNPSQPDAPARPRSEEHTSELQSRVELVCRL